MKKSKLAAFCAAILLSCGDEFPRIDFVAKSDEYAYCIFTQDEMCLEGPYTACPRSGMLSNSCVYGNNLPPAPPDGEAKSGFCIFEDDRICLKVFYENCPAEIKFENNCPAGYVSGNANETSSSSGDALLSSSGGSGNLTYCRINDFCQEFSIEYCAAFSGTPVNDCSVVPSSSSGGAILSSGSNSSSSSDVGDSMYCSVGGTCPDAEIPVSTCLSIDGTPVESCPIAPSSSSAPPSSSSVTPSSSSLTQSSSSSTPPSSSSVYVGTGGKGNNIANYKTKQIGTQNWMAENLNYDVAGSKCYNNLESNCDIYGRLYDWKTAMTVCPEGWHLPTQAEWDALSSYVLQNGRDAKYLKSTSGWNNNGNGTDSYGFAALPGGYGSPDGDFYRAGSRGRWWLNSEDNGGAYSRGMSYDSEVVSWGWGNKSYMYSVRCLQD